MNKVRPNPKKHMPREELVYHMAKLFIAIFVLGESTGDKPPICSRSIHRTLYDLCQADEFIPVWFRRECQFIDGSTDIPYDFENEIAILRDVEMHIRYFYKTRTDRVPHTYLLTSVADAVDCANDVGLSVKQAQRIGTAFFRQFKEVEEAERQFWIAVNRNRRSG